MIWILVLICAAVGGRELYTAFERRQQAQRWTALLASLAAVRADVEALAADFRAERGAERLTALEQGQAADERDRREYALALADLKAAVDELRQDQLVRLEQEVAQGTALRGWLSGDLPEQRGPLLVAYDRCLGAYGLQVRTHRSAQTESEAWSESYFLSGEALAWLPRALLGKAAGSPSRPGTHNGDEALHELLKVLEQAPGAVARIGAFAAVRTPTVLVCGLVDEPAESADPAEELAQLIQELPPEERLVL